MINDVETNIVYFSDLFPKACPDEFNQLTHWLDKFEVKYDLIKGCKDIWVRDFMPVQYEKGKFMQYKYDPDYLKPSKYRSTITDPTLTYEQIGITTAKTTIVIDAGNIVKGKNKVILTTKIFRENPGYPEARLVNEIKNQLEVEKVIIIPQEPGDFIGHADGMVRFIDDDTVLVNDYPNDTTYADFSLNLRSALRNAGLQCVSFPYTAWKNKDSLDATGCFINFLETGNLLFYPVYGNIHDQHAFNILKKNFKDRQIIDIRCNELAKKGGVLNCVSWNI
jgi:agmatine deiminase